MSQGVAVCNCLPKTAWPPTCLPKRSVTINYLIAKEDYYFVYPTDYHKYMAQYRDSFQHGGISMEEMILPVVKLTPKQ